MLLAFFMSVLGYALMLVAMTYVTVSCIVGRTDFRDTFLHFVLGWRLGNLSLADFTRSLIVLWDIDALLKYCLRLYRLVESVSVI
jgi:hypothetical protein